MVDSWLLIALIPYCLNNIYLTIMMPPPPRGHLQTPFQQPLQQQVVYSLPPQAYSHIRPPMRSPQPRQQLVPPRNISRNPQIYPQPVYHRGPPPQPFYLPAGRVMGYPGYTMPPREPFFHPGYDYNLNFNYEEANFLCDTKIVENKVFCVICGADYLASQRDQHLQRHARKGQMDRAVQRFQYKSGATHKGYQVRPIVEPDEHYIQQPLVYNFVQEILYEDPEPYKDQGIQVGGYEGESFDNGPNMSMDYGRDTRIPEIRTESNPFRGNRGKRVAQVPAYSSNERAGQEQGNTLNEQGNTLNEPSKTSYSRPPNRSNLSNNTEELVIDEGQNEYHLGNNRSQG